MRALVVSDLHSNAEALRAVFGRVRRKKFDRIVNISINETLSRTILTASQR